MTGVMIMKLPNLREAKVRGQSEVSYIEAEIKRDLSLFKGRKYYLKTYGCQMNVHDSELIANLLEGIGFIETDKMEGSDLVILNTCAIRENAHDKVFGFLGRCKHEKELTPEMMICVCGCMAQEPSVCEEILSKHPYIDLVFGTHNIHELPNLLLNCTGKTEIEVESKEGDVVENLEYTRDSKIEAWVNIMYGCDKFCTYCIVPYTRGKQRSRKSSCILREVENLAKEGYKEVTLLGQNVNAYGKDLEDELSFAELLLKVSDTGIPRIRFVTSHPWDFSDELIDTIASRDNIMPYIHLPLQSGSSRILKLMGRRYTKEEYLNLFEKIKTRIPNVAVTTDIIVGFPGETEKDFEDTLEMVKRCKYDNAFTFIFSPRIGTPAENLPDETPKEEKERRLARLNELVNFYSLEANKKYVGRTVDVLITGKSDRGSDKIAGYTDTMKLVNVTGPVDAIGKTIAVKITEAKSFSLNGEVEL